MSLPSEEDILVDDELSKSERRAKERYTKESAEENLKEIRAFSPKFLEILCSIFLSSSKDAVGFLQVFHLDPILPFLRLCSAACYSYLNEECFVPYGLCNILL